MNAEDRKIRLYRIMDFTRVVHMFKHNEIYFSSPSVWDDPWEKRIRHYKSDSLFSQCWCRKGSSDAMWRIYSPTGFGVRLSTTVGKLEQLLKSSTKSHNYQYRLRPVEYMPQVEISRVAREIRSDLEHDFDIRRAVDMLYYKREAFSHEDEWRSTIYFKDEKRVEGKKYMSVPFDPHDFFDSIYLDPRAPVELTDAFKFYFKNKFKFSKTVRQSVLYKVPSHLEVKSVSIEDLL